MQRRDDASDLVPLYDAVAAAPDDDRPRHVLSDALLERGDVRGEFIALQLLPAGIKAHASHARRTSCLRPRARRPPEDPLDRQRARRIRGEHHDRIVVQPGNGRAAQYSRRMVARTLIALVMVAALSARAEPEPAHVSPPSTRTWHAVLIGAVGLALAGGYATGAVLTGDNPSAVPLAVTGGVLSSGLFSTGITLGLGTQRRDPGSLASSILVPLISGVISAILGGVLAGFFAQQPGTMRTVTHVVITSLLVLDTIAVEFARLGP